MTEQALGPGGTVVRRQALFGLLDANGWGWAGVKATVWFVLIIMLMAYLPDRALYATVQNTIDFGVALKVFNPALDVTPINFCPASNETVPCPAPAGTVLPWEPSPVQLALPQARTDAAIVGAGLETLLVGGTDPTGTPQASVFATVIRPDGNIDAWSQGAPLPAPRDDQHLGRPGVLRPAVHAERRARRRRRARKWCCSPGRKGSQSFTQVQETTTDGSGAYKFVIPSATSEHRLPGDRRGHQLGGAVRGREIRAHGDGLGDDARRPARR